MTDSRQAILGRIQATLDSSSDVQQRKLKVQQRLTNPETGPARELGDSAIERFKQKLQQVASTYVEINDKQDIPEAVKEYLAQYQQPLSLAVAEHEQLDINWPDEFTIHHGAANKDDKVALSTAYAGIGETGSLALRSGPQTPTTLNFLPDYYICVVTQKDILMTMEELWSKHRKAFSSMPRALNIITGPSRTADVEQTIQLGAHGPRQLHVIIINE